MTTLTTEKMISDYIMDHVNVDELDYDFLIFEEGLVNSLFAIQLMTFLEKTFNIKITMDDLDIENYRCVNAISKFVKSKQGEV
ncbi:acyl carrier protein [Brevibacillus laterosporus]|uniref:acyl carrier protein n=1 Tax=Brevibacillus laterosporus TaxID=1465 RepID=UPI00037DD127|nr:acyl carrier protein [Brevibacillus laterosporus]MED2002549.1 acyl carrier protein [Brevibacillus laterosporus]MED4761942.1 acyl carrier protein [Brevibacillus laterosporus]TPH22992.1 acyl carrier protein [Brevibacillus laterosporus]